MASTVASTLLLALAALPEPKTWTSRRKRRGDLEREPLVSDIVQVESDGCSILDLDAAIARLAELDPDLGRLAEMRCFGGLSCDEVAKASSVSRRAVERSWRAAQAWLRRELAD